MSAYFSILDVYRAVKDNDLAAVEKAIFFLGVRIHKIKVWHNRTPLDYAATLGHLGIVDRLVRDLVKYAARNRLDDWNYWLTLVLKHKDGQPQKTREIVHWILNDYPVFSKDYVLSKLVFGEAFEFLDLILEDKDDYEKIVELCLKWNKRFSLLPRWVEENPHFLSAVQNYEVRDPLVIALVRGDVESVKIKIKEMAEDDRVEPRLIQMTVHLADTNILLAILDDSILRYTLSVTSCTDELMPVQALILAILSETDLFQICPIIEKILSHPKFYFYSVWNWTERYYELLFSGRVRSASCIEHLVDFSDQQRIRTWLQKQGTREMCGLRYLSVDEFMEVIEAIDFPFHDASSISSRRDDFQYQATDRSLDSVRHRFRDFPKRSTRPDLIQPLRDRNYELDYNEADTLNTEENK